MSSSPGQNPTDEAARQTKSLTQSGKSRAPGRVAQSDSGPKRNRPSDISRSRRRREQREREREQARSLQDPRQRAIDFAQKLLFLAEEYPEFRELATETAGRAHARANTSPDRDGDIVMNAIEKQYCRYDWEIADDTELQLDDVRKVLVAYVAAGRLKEVRIGDETQYVPTGKQHSPMVLP